MVLVMVIWQYTMMYQICNGVNNIAQQEYFCISQSHRFKWYCEINKYYTFYQICFVFGMVCIIFILLQIISSNDYEYNGYLNTNSERNN